MLETIRQWFTAAEEALRSLPIIRELWERIREPVTTPARRSEALDYFLTSGYSVRRAAAMLNPGAHGSVIVAQQDALEYELRAYTVDLEARLYDLQRAAAQASGHAAVQAQGLDRRIAALEKENEQLHARVLALLGEIERLRAALAEARAAAPAPQEAAPAAVA